MDDGGDDRGPAEGHGPLRPGRPHLPAQATRRGAPTPAEMLLARRAAARLGADRVALVLLPTPAERAVVRGSDTVLMELGDMMETVAEGPAHDALRSGRPCTVEDLRADVDRWALLAGAYRLPRQPRSLALLPLRTDGSPLGTLVLARDRPAPFSATETDGALRTADVLATALVRRAEHGDPDGADAVLDDLLDPRSAVVPQAVGLLMSRREATAGEARDGLVAEAFRTGQTLQRVATELVATP